MIIASTTSLIYLHCIGQLELLYQLFTQVTIPEEEAFLMISMRTTQLFVLHADCYVAISRCHPDDMTRVSPGMPLPPGGQQCQIPR